MKKIYSALLLAILSLSASGQFSSSFNVTNVSCNGQSDGIVEVNAEACFAPIQLGFNGFSDTFDVLKNDGYQYINHMAGPGATVAYGVWGGTTGVGDVYLSTGYFTDSLVIDDDTTLYGSAEWTMYLACYDAQTSELMWATKAEAGTTSYTVGYGVVVADDKVYVCGLFEGNCNFQGQTINSAGGYQAFISKYNVANGTLDTVVQVGNAGDEEALNIAYAHGRIYIVGNYTNSITLAGNVLASAGGYDVFVTCFDTAFTTNFWGAKGGGTGSDLGNDLVLHDNGSAITKVYITGEFAGNASFGMNNLSTTGAKDIYVASVDVTGNWLWARKAGSSGNSDRGIGIDINSTYDQLFVGGTFGGNMTWGTANFSASGTTDGFLAYLDTLGNLNDLYEFATTGADQILDVEHVAGNYVVFSGHQGGSLNYADSTFSMIGSRDAFVGKIGPGMMEVWGKRFGTTGDDAFNRISVTDNAKLHANGYFTGNASAFQTGLVSVSSSDAIVTNDDILGSLDTTLIFTGLPADSYILFLVDSLGNTHIDTAIVTEPAPLIASGVVTPATSSSALDGAIDVTVTGGTLPYSYLWNTLATTQDLNGIGVGTYTILVTDSNGCQDTASFVVDSVPPAFSSIGLASSVSCFGFANGSINLTVGGGTMPYTYLWSTGDTVQDLNNLDTGTYSVTITDSDTGNAVLSFTISQPDELTLSGTVVPPSSGSATNGGVNTTVGGGTTPYAYAWSNGSNSANLSGVGIGFYTLTLTDDNGCTVIETFHVDTIPALSVVLVSNDHTCINTVNGGINATVVGGVPPYSYFWNTGFVGEDLSGVSAGTYTITVTDSIGQQATATDSVSTNPLYQNPVVGPITGAASAQAWTVFNYSVPSSFGSTYSWSFTGGTVQSTMGNAANVLWAGGPSGLVRVIESDANGCQATDSLEVNILFVGIAETGAIEVSLYPVPADDAVFINCEGPCDNTELTLINSTGAAVWRGNLDEKTFLNTSLLPAGIYHLTFANQRGISHQQLTIVH